MLAASLVPLGSPSPRSRSHKMKGIGAITVKKIIETWRERERERARTDRCGKEATRCVPLEIAYRRIDLT